MSKLHASSPDATINSTLIIIVVMITVSATVSYYAINYPSGTNAVSTTTAPAITTTSLTTSTSSSSATSNTASIPLAWGASVGYPTEVWAHSCITWGGFMYCVGGLIGGSTVSNVTSAVYYAPLSSSGAGQWTRTTSYPVGIRSQSCVAGAGNIYCIGGYTNSTISNAVYFASLSSSGVGQWTSTTSYPAPVWTQSCVGSTNGVYSSSGIYCVGGITPSNPESRNVYYAPFSSSGLGQRTNTTSYPVGVRQQSCAISSSDLYCVGGFSSTSVYYAPLTASGVGQWTNTTSYPFTGGVNSASCVTPGSEIYCIGGFIHDSVYHATLSSSGVGQWTNSTNYPASVWGESCAASGTEIYCVGGNTASGSALINSVYYFEGNP